MDETNIRWDIELLNQDAKALRTLCDELAKRKDKLVKIRDTIGPSWNTPVGRAVVENLKIHIDKVDDVLTELEHACDALDESIRKNYLPAEQEITAAVRKLDQQ